MRRAALALALVLVVEGCGDDAEPAPTAAPAPTATSIAATTTASPPPATGAVATTGPAAVPPVDVPDFSSIERQPSRDLMVDTQIAARGVSDPLVLQAMREVPRHLFVPDDFVGQAYEDHPLPIGFGQTISQPYIVALMTESLGVEPGDRVLEIGTGSGYQAAILGQMGLDVYTVEIIPELAERSTALLADLGYANVATLAADGYFGWDEHAPFDAIIVTAAPDHVPQPLVGQLAEGGRMVIPVGPVGAFQTLWQFTKDASGELVAENLGGVAFVPFTREGG